MPNTNNNPEPGNAGNPQGKPTIGAGHNMNRLRSSGVSKNRDRKGALGPSAGRPGDTATPTPTRAPNDAGPR
ncbi:MAG TPA: hypothetical protein VD997_03505 [Phycisphaerales bacterium]|nr:hypothetical protein [Phycisphaerales bacterium]